MVFEQFYLDCLAQASYLVGDPKSGSAAIVDPREDVDFYLAEARARGLSIGHVVLTHLHADFATGHRELCARTGATLHLGRRARVEHEFHPLDEGDTIELGALRLVVLETPGHTPESISLLVVEGPEGTPPTGVLTGDTLFVGDVGRPDLLACSGHGVDEPARMLHRSLHQKLLALPDATRVWPGHGSGSLGGRERGGPVSSAIGEERRTNYALQPMSAEAFVELVTGDRPATLIPLPVEATLGRAGRKALRASLDRTLKPLPLAEVLRLRQGGAQVLDVREPVEFAAGHLVGSLNVGLGGPFATWSGILINPDRPVVLLADPGREREAAVRLGRIGLDGIEGFLRGGMGALRGSEELIQRSERVLPADLPKLTRRSSGALLVDVRTPAEFEAGHLEGAVSVPLSELRGRVDELMRARLPVVYCASGFRSSIAVSLLQQRGFGDAAELAGGYGACRIARASA